MYTGFVYFQENEIANYDRTVAYLNGDPSLGILGMRPPGFIVSDCGCPAAMDCDFVSPRLDDAPWFDTGDAASEDFAGVLMIDVQGFDSPLSRALTPNAIIGGSLGRQRAGPRTLLFDALLVANSCCGAEYGLRWLTEALRAGDCGTDCGLGELYMLKCCPPDGDTCHIEAAAIPFTSFDDQVPFTVSVVATGSRTWQVTVVDSDRAGAVSTPGGAANNTLGLLPTCLATLDSVAQFSIVPTPGSAFNILMIPSEAVTNIATGASGTGATAIIDLDLNLTDACDDVRRLSDDLEVALCRWQGTYLTTTISTLMLGLQQCWSVVDGYDSADYTRYMKRVGLVEGPLVLDRFGTCCSDSCASCQGSVIHVNWTLVSESPYIFSEVDWCLENESFDKDTDYCFDVTKLCEDCPEVATQTITREIVRPRLGIQLRHDGTWCPQGWSGDCPPEDTLLTITELATSAGIQDPASTTITIPDYDPPRLVVLQELPDGSQVWTPSYVNGAGQWEPSVVGMPPVSGHLTISQTITGCLDQFPPGDDVSQFGYPQATCVAGPTVPNCKIDVLANFGTTGTWGFGGDLPFTSFPVGCSVEVVTPPCPDASLAAYIRLLVDPTNSIGPWDWEWVGGNFPPGGPPSCYIVSEICYPTVAVVKLIYNECNDEKTWVDLYPVLDGMGEPISLVGGDRCIAIGEVEVIKAVPPPDACPVDYTDREINVSCDGTWAPISDTLDSCAEFPGPFNYSIGTVDGAVQATGPVEESIQIPGSVFIPDCGPTLLLPPAQTQSLFDCYCEPWCANRLCCTLNNMEQWSDATTYMTFYTGDAPLRNAKIQAFRNPFEDQGQTCPCDPDDEFWRCRTACAELQIPHLPAGALLTVDSSIQTATVRFNNGIEQNALRYVQGPGGAPFNWFDVGHCSTLCIVAQADCTVDANATVSVGLLNRYLASGT